MASYPDLSELYLFTIDRSYWNFSGAIVLLVPSKRLRLIFAPPSTLSMSCNGASTWVKTTMFVES